MLGDAEEVQDDFPQDAIHGVKRDVPDVHVYYQWIMHSESGVKYSHYDLLLNASSATETKQTINLPAQAEFAACSKSMSKQEQIEQFLNPATYAGRTYQFAKLEGKLVPCVDPNSFMKQANADDVQTFFAPDSYEGKTKYTFPPLPPGRLTGHADLTRERFEKHFNIKKLHQQDQQEALDPTAVAKNGQTELEPIPHVAEAACETRAPAGQPNADGMQSEPEVHRIAPETAPQQEALDPTAVAKNGQTELEPIPHVAEAACETRAPAGQPNADGMQSEPEVPRIAPETAPQQKALDPTAVAKNGQTELEPIPHVAEAACETRAPAGQPNADGMQSEPEVPRIAPETAPQQEALDPTAVAKNGQTELEPIPHVAEAACETRAPAGQPNADGMQSEPEVPRIAPETAPQQEALDPIAADAACETNAPAGQPNADGSHHHAQVSVSVHSGSEVPEVAATPGVSMPSMENVERDIAPTQSEHKSTSESTNTSGVGNAGFEAPNQVSEVEHLQIEYSENQRSDDIEEQLTPQTDSKCDSTSADIDKTNAACTPGVVSEKLDNTEALTDECSLQENPSADTSTAGEQFLFRLFQPLLNGSIVPRDEEPYDNTSSACEDCEVEAHSPSHKNTTDVEQKPLEMEKQCSQVEPLAMVPVEKDQQNCESKLEPLAMVQVEKDQQKSDLCFAMRLSGDIVDTMLKSNTAYCVFKWKHNLRAKTKICFVQAEDGKVIATAHVSCIDSIESPRDLRAHQAFQDATAEQRDSWRTFVAQKKKKLHVWNFYGLQRLDVPLELPPSRGRSMWISLHDLRPFVDKAIPGMDLHETCDFFIKRLSDFDSNKLGERIRALDGKTITIGSTCSGTDICVSVMKATMAKLNEVFGVSGLHLGTFLCIYTSIYICIYMLYIYI